MVTLIIVLKLLFFWIEYYNLAQHALKNGKLSVDGD